MSVSNMNVHINTHLYSYFLTSILIIYGFEKTLVFGYYQCLIDKQSLDGKTRHYKFYNARAPKHKLHLYLPSTIIKMTL